MKRSIALLAILMLAGLASGAQANKYDIKSGVITLETVMTVGKTKMTQTHIVYFDEFGAKECKETYENGKLTDVYFCDGKELIALKPAVKKAFRRGTGVRGTELRVVYDEMGTRKDFKEGRVKKLAPMTIAGQSCEVIEVTSRRGLVSRYAGWNKALVYMTVQSKSTTSETKAVKMEANAAVPAEKFVIPAGYTVE